MRDTLFISHCTPEDNGFTTWIGTRLQLAGYKVWYDLKGLAGGERDFLYPIDKEIRENASKFLLVISSLTLSKDGVLDEFEFAKSIAKQYDIKDFVLPLRIEDVPYNLRVGQNRYNHIDFTASWAQGLRTLIKKLQSDKVPHKDHQKNESIAIWYQNEFSVSRGILKTSEKYYTNWWPIGKLPENLFIFQFVNETQAEAVLNINKEYPLIRHGNCLVSFNDTLERVLEGEGDLEIVPGNKTCIPVSKILQGFEGKQFPTLSDAEYLMKRILNRSFHLIMKKRGLFWYELSNHLHCYYFPKDKIYKNKATIIYPRRKKTKNLLGSYYSSKWHFAVSNKTRLNPIICFSLKSHILFSDNGINIWENKDRIHSARRRKGKTWFNEEWRDQLMAFLFAVKDKKDDISMKLSSTFELKMPPLTKTYISNYGYMEPKSQQRQSVLADSISEIEHYNQIED